MDGSSGSSDDESYVQGSCSSDEEEPDIDRAALRREAAELEFKASDTPTKDTELLVKVMKYFMSDICPSIDAFIEEHGGEFEELRREQSHEGMALHSNFRDVVEERLDDFVRERGMYSEDFMTQLRRHADDPMSWQLRDLIAAIDSYPSFVDFVCAERERRALAGRRKNET